MTKINLTTTIINSLTSQGNDRKYYQDDKLQGLCVMVTRTGHKSFYLNQRINGKAEKIKIGNHPDLHINEAREIALEYKNGIAKGINPKEKQLQEKTSLTVEEGFNIYVERYAKLHKKSYAEDVRCFRVYFKELANKKLKELTRMEITNWHTHIGVHNGKRMANVCLVLLSSMYNKSILWDLVTTNPAKGITKFKEKSRDRFLQPEELERFFQVVDNYHNKTVVNYIYLALYTGARKNNILSMQWQDINFEQQFWTIRDSKNGEDLKIPLIEPALEILNNIKASQKTDSPFVFPSNSKAGHLLSPKRAWTTILKEANITDLKMHDLRRTLGSYQAIAGASLITIGKSLGHKSSISTQIYARMNLSPVRDSMKKAVDLMKGKDS